MRKIDLLDETVLGYVVGQSGYKLNEGIYDKQEIVIVPKKQIKNWHF